MTGSHNLDHKASFNNDENLVIVKGYRGLAEAYATHVLDIYDHFSWRGWYSGMGRAGGERKDPYSSTNRLKRVHSTRKDVLITTAGLLPRSTRRARVSPCDTAHSSTECHQE